MGRQRRWRRRGQGLLAITGMMRRTALYDLCSFKLSRPLPSCVFSSVFSPRYDLMNRISDRPDQFFLSICNGVSNCLACGTILCGSCILLHVLLNPMLIICRFRDDSLAYVSNPCFRRVLAYLPTNLVHGLCSLCFFRPANNLWLV